MPETIHQTAKRLGLTRAQHTVLRALYAYLEKYGTVPTCEELGKRLGVQKTGIHHHLQFLAEKGWLVFAPGSRNARLAGVKMTPVIEDSEAGNRLRAVLGIEEPTAALA